MSPFADQNRPPPDFSVVLEMAEEYMAGAAGGCAELWQVRAALSEKLPGSLDRRGNLSQRFNGQVYRALNRLVDESKLVRPRDTSQIEYFTPEGWEQHQRKAAARQAEREEARRRHDAANAVLLEHGFDMGGMPLEDWEVLASWMRELPSAYTSGLRGWAFRKGQERKTKEKDNG